MRMKVSLKMTWACGLACAGMAGLGISPASGETAGTGGNPYAIISERNVFHLTDPPPPPTKESPKVEVQKVMADAIVISYTPAHGDWAMTKVYFRDLPAEIRQQYEK